MTAYPEIAARFARDTSAHEMVVLHDKGLYRHLIFREPTHGFYWFELITTPNQLVFSGDGTSYVFRRAADMFQFFRSGIWRDGTHNINPGYWSEKLTSGREAATSYSIELFEQEVTKTLADVEGDYPGITAAWTEHVESEFNTEYEEEARRAVAEFQFGEAHLAKCSACDWFFEGESYTVAARNAREHRQETGDKHTAPVRDLTFTFSDMDEVQFQDFDWWFLWACQATVWGIARYDRVRKYGLQQLAIGDLAASAVAEGRCMKAPTGCGRPLIAEDGTARVFWDEAEAQKYEAEWRKTGLCPDCQDARAASKAVAA